jgi:hypothetical protein
MTVMTTFPKLWENTKMNFLPFLGIMVVEDHASFFEKPNLLEHRLAGGRL